MRALHDDGYFGREGEARARYILFSLQQKKAELIQMSCFGFVLGFFPVQEKGKLWNCSSGLIIVMLENFA